MAALYDTIGINYADLRHPDPSIEGSILAGLGDAANVLNVGAGTGSYEPRDRTVTAVEISRAMIRQRPPGAAPVIQASAMQLPFNTGAFDASMAVLTVHHWSDRKQGLRELRRVTKGPIVILTWDPSFAGFWLNDYLPGILEIDRAIFPPLRDFATVLGPSKVSTVPIPHDCTDGFMCAYWQRPRAYLDDRVRSAISTFSKLGNISASLAALAHDVKSGAWKRQYGEILNKTEMDMGYRLVVAIP